MRMALEHFQRTGEFIDEYDMSRHIDDYIAVAFKKPRKIKTLCKVQHRVRLYNVIASGDTRVIHWYIYEYVRPYHFFIKYDTQLTALSLITASEEVRNWMYAHGMPVHLLKKLMRLASFLPNFELMTWLHERGCRADPTVNIRMPGLREWYIAHKYLK